MKASSHIPNSLREKRLQAGMRQLDVAAKLGFCTTDRISKWEKGLAVPHIVNLFKLAALYGVLPHELYKGAFEEVVNILMKNS